MKVLLVTNLFPTPIDPERGIFTLQLAKQLSKHCELTVVCPLPWFPKLKIFRSFKRWYSFSLVPYQYEIDGVNVISPKYPMIPKISEFVQAKLMTFGLKKCIHLLNQQFKFDIVNSHWLYPDSVAVDAITFNLNIPHIATGLGCDINHDLFDKDKRTALIKMLKRANAITVVSSDLKKVLVKDNISESKIYTLPNGVNIKQFNQQDKILCRNKLGLKGDKKIILYVGRLSEEKNIARLIEAFSSINTDRSQDLYIVGDGPLKENLENLSLELNIKESIHFIGKVEHTLISIWMGACDLFCLPSIREGCPNVVMEALGCGRPVIASDVGGIPDMVSEGTGILFNPQDVNNIAESLMLAIKTNWDTDLIANSVKKMTWKHAALNYLSLYKKIVDSTKE